MTEGTAWELLLDAAKQLSGEGESQFTRAQLIERVRRVDPSRHRATLDPIIQGMTDNASGGPLSACGHVFHRVGRGEYVMLDGAGQGTGRRIPTLTAPRPGRSTRVQPKEIRRRTSELVDFWRSVHGAVPLTCH